MVEVSGRGLCVDFSCKIYGSCERERETGRDRERAREREREADRECART